MSLAIEASQYFFKLGLCETSDVIMITFGATIGVMGHGVTNCLRSFLQKRAMP